MKRVALICLALAGTLWAIFGALGRPVADAVSRRFGHLLLKLGEGKVSSAADFLHQRLFETIGLLSALLIWVLLHAAIHSMGARWNCLKRHGWMVHALVGFVALNLWVGQASRTAVFWVANWEGIHTQNLARFHLKTILAREQPAIRRAALVGSSQTRAQIDEAVLNGMLAPRLRTTELAYPGCKALDVLLMHKRIGSTKPDYIVWYVSEAMFYSGTVSEVIPNFLTVNQLPDLVRRDAIRFAAPEYLGSGLMGSIVPIFRLREVFTQRILGPQIGNLQQAQYDAGLEADLATRAQRAAGPYRINEESRMHEQALEDFIRRCGQSGQQVILLAGQMHPAFQSALDPAIRPHMLAFLRSLALKHANVVLIEDLPEQMADDYEDLTHVNRRAQIRFSTFLGSRLEALRPETLEPPR